MAYPHGQNLRDSPGSHFQHQSTQSTPQFVNSIPAASTSSNNMVSKKPLAISNLMISPPEPELIENFHQAQQVSPMPPAAKQPQAMQHERMTPPISPHVEVRHSLAPEGTIHAAGVKDPVLYPSSEAPSTPPRTLFPDANVDAEQYDMGIASYTASPLQTGILSSKKEKPPTLQSYRLVAGVALENYRKDPTQYDPTFFTARARAVAEAKELDRIRQEAGLGFNDIIGHRPKIRQSPAGTLVARTGGSRVSKPQKATTSNRTKTPAKSAKEPAMRPIRALPQPNKTARRTSRTPEPQVKKSGPAPMRQDKDFLAITDYSPPIESLATGGNKGSLKIRWKDNPVDLSEDRHRHLLHRDELYTAAELRLDCATYLTCKRRIFKRRLECLAMAQPKEFRKTDAQGACFIDVNKASKLWEAFSNVGWLEKKWMKPEWIDDVRQQLAART